MRLYRRERHWRVAIFFGGAALAGAFGGLCTDVSVALFCNPPAGVLAYAIGLMEGVGGRRGWQWYAECTLYVMILTVFFKDIHH